MRLDFGGIYDCTNIADGMISVITDIGFDHMDILGNSIEEVTNAKAGIIKKGNDTVMYKQENVTQIIENVCAKKNNILHLVDKNNIRNYFFYDNYQKIDYKNHKDILINLKGKCQIYNASLALECFDILREKGYKIDEKAISYGLKTVKHPARFEVLNENPKFIFDGAHNENAVKNFNNMINMYYKNHRKIFIISLLKSKDYKTVIKLIMENNKNNIFIFTSR